MCFFQISMADFFFPLKKISKLEECTNRTLKPSMLFSKMLVPSVEMIITMDYLLCVNISVRHKTLKFSVSIYRQLYIHMATFNIF